MENTLTPLNSPRYSLTQQVHFSCGHRYASPELSEDENRQAFGRDFTPHGLGHNFIFEAEVSEGLSGPELQMALKQVSELLDHRFLNQDVEHFQSHVPSAENIAVFLFSELEALLESSMKAVRLQRVRLVESRDFWVDYRGLKNPAVAQVSRRYVIQCLHRHHNPDLSMEENKQLYHKCSAVHGHEYKVEVLVEGPIHPVTGLVMSREALDSLVHEVLIAPFHGQFLNDHLGNTSGEIIVEKFFARLESHWPESFPRLLGLVLRETRKNSFYKMAER